MEGGYPLFLQIDRIVSYFFISDSLRKYDTPPMQSSNARAELLAASQLLIICIQLQELGNRARVSFNLAQIHLRTPPAPTFAPLVLSLFSLCAQIHAACLDALWREEGLAYLYQFFRGIRGVAPDAKPLMLDGEKQIHKQAMERILNLLQNNKTSRLDWLPNALARQGMESKLLKANGEIKEPMLLNASSSAMIDDEDLGEAV